MGRRELKYEKLSDEEVEELIRERLEEMKKLLREILEILKEASEA